MIAAAFRASSIEVSRKSLHLQQQQKQQQQQLKSPGRRFRWRRAQDGRDGDTPRNGMARAVGLLGRRATCRQWTSLEKGITPGGQAGSLPDIDEASQRAGLEKGLWLAFLPSAGLRGRGRSHGVQLQPQLRPLGRPSRLGAWGTEGPSP